MNKGIFSWVNNAIDCADIKDTHFEQEFYKLINPNVGLSLKYTILYNQLLPALDNEGLKEEADLVLEKAINLMPSACSFKADIVYALSTRLEPTTHNLLDKLKTPTKKSKLIHYEAQHSEFFFK